MHDNTVPIPRVTDEPEIPTGHGHGHGHRPAEPASRNVRRLLTWLLLPFAIASVVGVAILYPIGDTPSPVNGQQEPVRGEVTAASLGSCDGGVQVGTPDPACLVLTVRMSDGPAPGREIVSRSPNEPSTPRFAVGDKVVLAYSGGDPAAGESYRVADFQRGLPLAVLAALFALAILVLGRYQGLAALVALGVSFLVLLLFVLPAILTGENPLLVAVAGAGLIMFVALYLTHGLSARTSTAVLGTMISLVLIGVLGALFSAITRLTGIDEDTSSLLGALGHGLDTRGLLLAGLVIGALGVLDDVTVTQASAVWELRRANPLLSWRELYAAGLRIGRDHVSSAVNTLAMAYAGAALPVLLLSYLSGAGLGTILGSQSIAQELVRTLVGSIGLVACVPVTTLVAALVASREPATPAKPRTSSRPQA
ncbi:YibE/F family protein [Kibdelosporangium philippinense]|uniref:YibE/F family protein n=1 Tax=Kibdelosporangium philippinense TaxID=211113 RepID=A0ABS8ZU79_9PSEU|nr:YibE/F family protein [Kibdelosporangium philippinense]MCE7010540.1 YibE/F family protein [Kibdelosporangium philippinense]